MKSRLLTLPSLRDEEEEEVEKKEKLSGMDRLNAARGKTEEPAKKEEPAAPQQQLSGMDRLNAAREKQEKEAATPQVSNTYREVDKEKGRIRTRPADLSTPSWQDDPEELAAETRSKGNALQLTQNALSMAGAVKQAADQNAALYERSLQKYQGILDDDKSTREEKRIAAKNLEYLKPVYNEIRLKAQQADNAYNAGSLRLGQLQESYDQSKDRYIRTLGLGEAKAKEYEKQAADLREKADSMQKAGFRQAWEPAKQAEDLEAQAAASRGQYASYLYLTEGEEAANKYAAGEREKEETTSLGKKILNTLGGSALNFFDKYAGSPLTFLADIMGMHEEAEILRNNSFNEEVQRMQQNAGSLGSDIIGTAGAAGHMMSLHGIGSLVAGAIGLSSLYSTLGEIANSSTLVTSAASRAGAKLANNLLTEVISNPGNAAISLSSGVSGFYGAQENGATYEQALTNGILKGLTEYYSNKMFSGMPFENKAFGGVAPEKGYVTQVIEYIGKKLGMSEVLTKFAASGIGKALGWAFDIGGEGMEEVITGVADPIIDRITYDKNADWKPKADQLIEEFEGGVLLSLLMSGGEAALKSGMETAQIKQQLMDMGYTKEIANTYAPQIRKAFKAAEKMTQAVQQAAEQATPETTLARIVQKVTQGEALTGQDARKILADPEAMQALIDGGYLGGTVRNDSDGRKEIVRAAEEYAEENAAETAPQPEAETAPPVPGKMENAPETPETVRATENNAQIGEENAQNPEKPLSGIERLNAARAALEAPQEENTQKKTGGLRLTGMEAQERPASRGLILGNDRTEGTNNGTAAAENTADVSDRNGRRGPGERTRRETAKLARETSKWRALPQQDKAAGRQAHADDLQLEAVDARSLGVTSAAAGSTVRVYPRSEWEPDLQRIAARVEKATGQNVTFVLGQIRVDNNGKPMSVRGVNTGRGIIVQADALGVSAEKIATHEAYHSFARADKGLNERVLAQIRQQYPENRLRQIAETYLARMNGIVDLESTDQEVLTRALKQVQEEICADAYAGINAFAANVDEYTQAARQAVTESRNRQTDEATERRTGPPEMDRRYGPDLQPADYEEAAKYAYNRATPVQTRLNAILNSMAEQLGIAHDDDPQKSVKSIVSRLQRNRQNGKKPGVWVLKDLARGHLELNRWEDIPKALELLRQNNIPYTTEVKNTEQGYRGLHVLWNDGGIGVELQLSTPEAWKIKMATEKIYSKWREADVDSLTPKERLEYNRDIEHSKELWAMVQLPDFNSLLNSASDTGVPLINRSSVGRNGGLTQEPSLSIKTREPGAASKSNLKMRSPSSSRTMDAMGESLPSFNILAQKGNNVNDTIEDERYSAADDEEYIPESAAEYGQLKRQGKVKAPKVKTPVAKSRVTIAKADLKKNLLGLYSIPAGSRAELGNMIDAMADRYIREGRIGWNDRKELMDKLYESGVVFMEADDGFQAVRDMVRNGRIYVSESAKKEWKDTDYQDFRREAFAEGIYLVNDESARGWDSWNAELAEAFPGIFDENEYDPREALERIVQVAREGRGEKLSLAEYAAQMAGMEFATEEDMMDNLERQADYALKAFAEKADLEIYLKDRTGRMIAQERQRMGELRDQAVQKERERGNKRVEAAKERGQEILSQERAREIKRRQQEREHRKEVAQRLRERQAMRELQQKTLKQLQWLNRNRNKFSGDMQTEVNKILEDIDIYAASIAEEMHIDKKTGKTWKELRDIYKEAKQNDPNFLPSAELERIVARLDYKKIGDLDIGALNDLYKAAVGLRTELYNRNNVIDDELHSTFAEVYEAVKEEMQETPGSYETGVKGGINAFLNDAQLTPMNRFQRMAGWNPNSRWYGMAKMLEKGEREQRRFKTEANRQIAPVLEQYADWARRADGKGKDAIWYEIKVPASWEYHMGDKPVFSKETVTVYMTPAQKVHMYLESKNLDNLRHMEGGRTFANKELYSKGERAEAFAQGTTVKLLPETVKSIVSDLTEEEQALANALEAFYNDYSKKEINRVSNILYGYDKAMGGYYAPIYTNNNYTKSEPGIFDLTAEGVGNLKSRVVSANPSLNLSAFDAFEKSVDKTGRFVGLSIPVRNLNTLINWREQGNSTKEILDHKWGEKTTQWVEDLMTELQSGKERSNSSIEALTNKALSRYITAVFGANPSIVAKQFASHPLAATYLDWKNLITGLAHVGQADPELISKYTGELDYRMLGYAMPETAQIKDNPGILQRKGPINFLFGGGAITWMDGFTVRTLWSAAEQKVSREQPDLEIGTQEQINAGQSPYYQAVAKEFEEAVSRSQPMYDTMHRSNIMRETNPITRAFTLFKTVPQQEYNMLRQAVGEAEYYKRTGADKEIQAEARKKAGRAFAGVLIGNLMIGVVSFLNALWKNKGKNFRDEEGELTPESVAKGLAKQYFKDTAGLAIGGDIAADVLSSILFGDKWYGLEMPGLEQLGSILEQSVNAGKTVQKTVADSIDILRNGGDWGQYMADHSETYLKAVDQIVSTLGTYATGLPMDNVKAYLLGGVQWISPQIKTAYDDLMKQADKSGLKGLAGASLEMRTMHILQDRAGEASERTAETVAGLYEAGYTDAVPATIQSSYTVNGEDRKMSAADDQLYRQVWRDSVSGTLDDLTRDKVFRNMGQADQAKVLKKLYDYGAQNAKEAVWPDYSPDKWVTTAKGLEAKDVPLSEWLPIQQDLSKISGKNKKQEIRDYIDSLPYSRDQKKAMYTAEGYQDADDVNWHSGSYGGSSGKGKTYAPADTSKLQLPPSVRMNEQDRELWDMESHGGNVNLRTRKTIPVTLDNIKTVRGWGMDSNVGDYMTVASQTYRDGDRAVVVTPILPDGSLMTQTELDTYMDSLRGSDSYADADDRGIILGVFDEGTWQQNLKESDAFAERIHELHEEREEQRKTSGLKLPSTPKARTTSSLRLNSTPAAKPTTGGLRLK